MEQDGGRAVSVRSQIRIVESIPTTTIRRPSGLTATEMIPLSLYRMAMSTETGTEYGNRGGMSGGRRNSGGRNSGGGHLFARRTTTTARLTDDAEAMGNDLDPVLCTVGPATAHRRPHAIQLLGRLFPTDLPSPACPTFRLSATEPLPFREQVQDGIGMPGAIGSGGSTRYTRTDRPPSRPAPS